jgi:hypothetical protein
MTIWPAADDKTTNRKLRKVKTFTVMFAQIAWEQVCFNDG